MSYEFKLYGLEGAECLEDFFSSVPNALLYHSIKYARLLSEFLEAEYCCVVAVDGAGAVVGSIPFFIKESNGSLVANSMPFYGSHGGVVLREPNDVLFSELLGFYLNYVEQRGCSVSTIIASPFTDDAARYESYLQVTPSDSRLGQVTELPCDASYEVLIASLPSKTRNMVRKAEKQNIKWTSEYIEGGLDFLFSVHCENMHEIGGVAKPARFFELIKSNFEYGTDYRVYTAYFEGQPVSALLLFYSGETVEYFTPVIKAEYRSMQPLTALIFNAMREAVERGYRFWNWGGTWATQEGVYRFKKSWSAVDIPYNYYSTVFKKSFLDTRQEALLSEYPYFYTVPFGWLSK
ncbi:GNAT family N-acetyltransferase [Pseudomonas guineae]|uniref:GNAT family N-acetyltransferase n=1 Tax=Pseudomonas guineae TaxID=425504 RepID=UPI003D09393E